MNLLDRRQRSIDPNHLIVERQQHAGTHNRADVSRPRRSKHGSISAYRKHFTDGETPCDLCREANNRYHRRLRKRLAYLQRSPLVPSIGPVRRAKALAWMGWTQADIYRAAGADTLKPQSIAKLESRPSMNRATAAIFYTAFEKLCMTHAPDSRQATRVRNMARAKGWAPPLAWWDIDNPIEEPSRMLKND